MGTFKYGEKYILNEQGNNIPCICEGSALEGRTSLSLRRKWMVIRVRFRRLDNGGTIYKEFSASTVKA